MNSSFRILLFTLVLALFAAGFSPLAAQTFPAAAQVTADYPDAVQQFAAFNILYVELSRIAPKPLSTSDYDTNFSYQASSNAIATQQMAADGANSQAYRDFNTQCDQLMGNQTFANSVVAKYDLPAMTVHAIAPTPVVLAHPSPA